MMKTTPILILLTILLQLSTTIECAEKPPPPTIHNMESVLLAQYVLMKDTGRQPPPELVEVVRDISRRYSTGCRTTGHYEMETELFRYILRSNSMMYVNNLREPLSFLNVTC
jgi:hypothetical protein